MSREDYIRASLALIMVEMLPPLIRDAVAADTAFTASLALTSDGIITFHPSNVGFKKSVLFDAVREASRQDEATSSTNDEEGRAWAVKFERDQEPAKLSMSSESGKFYTAHLGVLSDRPEERVKMLDAEAARVNLPAQDRDRWASIALQRPLTDDEVGDFASDVNNTPVAVAAAISGTLNDENVSIDVLVPRSLKYYERLVGSVGDQLSIKEYTDQVLVGHMRQLLGWYADDGFKHCLLLCSHSLVAIALAHEEIPSDGFLRALNWASERGDAMARCALVEIGLLRTDADEETAKGLAKVVKALARSEGEFDEQFEMLSAAFIATYGQLSYTKVLGSRPAYWRRLAAFAQAALITRCMAPKSGHLSEFAGALRKIRARPYSLQGYCDLRLGPLWQSQSAMPRQLRNELVGRVVVRAANRVEAARSQNLETELLGDEGGSLKSSIDLYLATMPGPLEDNVAPVRELTADDQAAIVSALSEERPTVRSFALLMSSVCNFKQPPEFAELAAATLQRAQYRIDAEGERIAFAASLVGLATVASVARSAALADAVVTVIRWYRRFFPAELDLNDAMRAGIIASASRADLPEWASVLGNFMSEFAFQNLSRDEAVRLHEAIVDLCELIPELWASCGPALAASEAVAA